ncbi:redoxin domain-containing protein, partial [candidate division KSB1 bacterium]|nr:redoxin domain-containing protein [candidate division KSB1 bacterium]
MYRKLILLFVLILVIFQCGSSPEQVVMWSPEQPHSGESIIIQYNSHCENAAISNVSNIVSICEIYSDEKDSIIVIPMSKKKNHWVAELQLPTSVYLTSIKFEDELNRVDDNNGRGWSVIILDENNNIQQNTHYAMGQIYRGRNRSEALPYYRKAIDEFQKELELYPQNYKTWFDLWEARMVLNENMAPRIEQQLDSLLDINRPSYELIKLAMFTHWRLLKNNEKALQNAIRLKKAYSHLDSFDEVAFPMIYLQNAQNSQEQIIALEKFVVDNPESQYLETAYFRLGNYYLQQRENLKAQYIFQKLNEIAPDNVANKLSLSSMEINNKNYDIADELLTEARNYCTEEQMRLRNPWTHPGKRKNQLNIDLCQIYSLTANLNAAIGDHLASIENRIVAIDLGTPFPAFEWEHIGRSYLELNDIKNAKRAFIKALSINPSQKNIRNYLHKIYISENGTSADFEQYIDNAIKEELKESAYPASDFEAILLNGDTRKLSDVQGKIIVINFWNTWSNACIREIPALNKLASEFSGMTYVEFWAISDENSNVIQSFQETHPFNYKQFCKGSNIRKQYKVIGFPTHIVVDQEGLIRYKYVGFTPDINHRLKENIQFLLRESKIIS